MQHAKKPSLESEQPHRPDTEHLGVGCNPRSSRLEHTETRQCRSTTGTTPHMEQLHAKHAKRQRHCLVHKGSQLLNVRCREGLGVGGRKVTDDFRRHIGDLSDERT